MDLGGRSLNKIVRWIWHHPPVPKVIVIVIVWVIVMAVTVVANPALDADAS